MHFPMTMLIKPGNGPFMSFFDCFKTIVTKMATGQWFDICETNNDKKHIRNIYIICKIIIIVSYKIAENVPFIGEFQKMCNKININHSPSQYWLENNQYSSMYRLQALDIIMNIRAPLEVSFDCIW